VVTYRHIAADLVRALAVLALVFLSFSHQSIAVEPHDHGVLSAAVGTSFCGDAPEGDLGHAPCHACRIGNGAVLPPTSEGLLHLRALAEPVEAEAAAAAFVPSPPELPEARGPPTFA
jgi:hypothetical protein